MLTVKRHPTDLDVLRVLGEVSWSPSYLPFLTQETRSWGTKCASHHTTVYCSRRGHFLCNITNHGIKVSLDVLYGFRLELSQQTLQASEIRSYRRDSSADGENLGLLSFGNSGAYSRFDPRVVGYDMCTTDLQFRQTSTM
jgi:hypothetical protein